MPRFTARPALRQSRALLIGALMLLVATPVGAQEAPEPDEPPAMSYTMRARSTGLTVEAFGESIGTIADSQVFISSRPTATGPTQDAASAAATGLSIDAIGAYGVSSESTDPTEPTDGADCVTPPSPHPAVTVNVACGQARAGIVDGFPDAHARASIEDIGIDGSALADDFLAAELEAVQAALPDAFAAAQDALTASFGNELATLCETPELLPGGLDLPGLGDLGGAVGDVADAVGGAVGGGGGGGIGLLQAEPCDVFDPLLADLPVFGASIPADVDLSTAAISAFGGVDLLTATIVTDARASVVDGEPGATAGYEALRVRIGSLQAGGAAINDVLRPAVEEFAAALDEAVAPLGEAAPEAPNAADVLAELRAQLPMSILADPEPVLEVRVSGTVAAVGVDDDGQLAPVAESAFLTGTLSPSVAEFLGVDRAISSGEGQQHVFGEETPFLTSFTSAGVDVTEDGANALGFQLSMLDTDDGGLVFTSGTTSAQGEVEVRPQVTDPTPTPAQPSPTPTPDNPLPATPRTGGGAAFAAFAMLGSAALVRRRPW